MPPKQSKILKFLQLPQVAGMFGLALASSGLRTFEGLGSSLKLLCPAQFAFPSESRLSVTGESVRRQSNLKLDLHGRLWVSATLSAAVLCGAYTVKFIHSIGNSFLLALQLCGFGHKPGHKVIS